MGVALFTRDMIEKRITPEMSPLKPFAGIKLKPKPPVDYREEYFINNIGIPMAEFFA